MTRYYHRVRHPKTWAAVALVFLAVLAVEAFRHFILGSW